MNTTDATPVEIDLHFLTLNQRFDERAKELKAIGFSYVRLEELDFAVFSKKRRTGRQMNLPAALVLCADPIVWQDYLARAKRFCD